MFHDDRLGMSLSFSVPEARLPPKRIHPPNRIRRIRIQINPTRQSNGVGRGEPAYIRVVEPEGVVVQSGLAIKVLALKRRF